MTISFDLFTEAFLSKISEYEFIRLPDYEREKTVDGFMSRSMNQFRRICAFTLTSDPITRSYYTDDDIDVPSDEIDEIVDIVSEGMVVQWLKPYANRQDLLENVMSTRDYSVYSTSTLLSSVRKAYSESNREFIQMMREYSYNHGDLTRLHL